MSRSHDAQTGHRIVRRAAKHSTAPHTTVVVLKKAESPKPIALSPELIAAARQPFLRAADIRSHLRPAPNADAEALKLAVNEETAPTENSMESGVPPETLPAESPVNDQDTVPVEPEPDLPAEPVVTPADPLVLARTEAIVRSALSYRGAPYRLGATGRYGAFDCSSFTRHILGQSGTSLPRTAAEQFQHGEPVAREALLPGDLVFFRNTYKRGISHVGIYIGNDKFIHASNRRTGVTVTTLSTAYYSRHYAGARRVR